MERETINNAFQKVFEGKKFDLPIMWDGVDFYKTLYLHLKAYQTALKEQYSDSELQQDVKRTCRCICQAVSEYYQGFPAKAYEIATKRLTELTQASPLWVDPEEVALQSLFRVVDTNDRAKHDRKRMFHAPFSKRSSVATHRYGIPGFPTLYLATTLELCIEEIGVSPNSNTLLAARFALQTEKRHPFNSGLVSDNSVFEILDLATRPQQYFPSNNTTNEEISLPEKTTYLRWYPILAACSYIRARKQDSFSSEYIFPQLITQWIRSRSERSIVGIRYFSCASVRFSQQGYNYAFPTRGIPYTVRNVVTDYCHCLAFRFKLTEPCYVHEFETIEKCSDKLKEGGQMLDFIKDPQQNEDKITGKYKVVDGERAIGAYAFWKCDKLTEVIIPDSVTSIGEGAFFGCRGLRKITIPDSVTSIGNGVFSNCSQLKCILVSDENTIYKAIDNCLIDKGTKTLIAGCQTSTIPTDGTVTSIGEGAFFDCSGLAEITIPDSIISIGDGAFARCSGLIKITIPDSVTSIGKGVFSNCSQLKCILVSDENTIYKAIDNCLIDRETKTLIAGCQTSTIPTDGTVTSIGDWAFACCRGLTKITIPDSVTSIGDWAFARCRGLTKITIPDSITSIGDEAFFDCSGLPEITIPDSIISIGDWAFAHCSGLTKITIPDSIISIGDWAFFDCSGLPEITIPDSIISIGDWAFARCSGLTEITIPDSITSIGDSAFFDCSGLSEIKIPDSVTSIGDRAFVNCSGLPEITIPDSVTSIGKNVFLGCDNLEKINIHNTNGTFANVDWGCNAEIIYIP